MAMRFSAVDDAEMAVEACQYILRIRHADKDVKKKAKEYLEWVFSDK